MPLDQQLHQYRRFAMLNAAQKASARKIHASAKQTVDALVAQLPDFDVGDLKPVPIVDCWFLPTNDTEVSPHGFFEREPGAMVFLP